MDDRNPNRGPDPLDDHDETHLAGLTGMTDDAAKTFLGFHTGMRWLRPRDESDS